ncbi:MAG: DsrE family protein [Thermoanaerobaculia bacterium]
MAKILNIVESAYRATLEEQDDTVLWFAHMLANAGADIAILLRGNAVNYLAKEQRVGDLSFGGEGLGNPPRLAEDVAALHTKKNVPIYYVEEDARERGLGESSRIELGESIPRSGLPKLVAAYDRVFHW